MRGLLSGSTDSSIDDGKLVAAYRLNASLPSDLRNVNTAQRSELEDRFVASILANAAEGILKVPGAKTIPDDYVTRKRSLARGPER